MNKHERAISQKAADKETQMWTAEANMPKKILPEKKLPARTPLLSGWALVEEAISIEEAERERLMREIPCFREQAIQTIAYWMSLSRRIDAMSRTRQLLALMPTCGFSTTEPSHVQSGLTKND